MENQNIPEDHRTVLHQWQAPEFIPIHRSKRWYLVASLLFGGLILLALFTRNITMALVFILAPISFLIIEKRPPRVVNIQITDMGIFYGNKFYPFHQINAFWLVYHPPYVTRLYLKLREGKKLIDLKIELNGENPIQIRQWLINEIPEIEGAHEPLMDIFTRLLRLH